jgi:DNA-binding response OmpR family regulator
LPAGAPVVYLLLPQQSDFMKGGLRILTVEDEPAVTQLLALILGGPSAKVTNACDGRMALMKIAAAEEPFDVIITDHNMPRLSGLELVRRLRLRKYPGKIVVLSAYLSQENIEAYEKLQVDMMLAKPFDIGELQLAIELLTKKSSPQATAASTVQS